MRVLKAYADAGAMGQQNFGSMNPVRTQREQAGPKQTPAKRGDSISLSDEAREALANGGATLSATPHDATYDKQGNMTRQFDNLQSELRALAAEFINEPGAAKILGRLGSMQSQVASLRTQV